MANNYLNKPGWPQSWAMCHIHGSFLDSNGNYVVPTYDGGTLVSGYMTFKMNPSIVYYQLIQTDGNKRIVVPNTITVTLSTSGKVDAYIPASDEPNAVPSGWSYDVVEVWDGGRSYSVYAPSNGDLDLVDAMPVQAFAGIVGPTVISNPVATYDGGLL